MYSHTQKTTAWLYLLSWGIFSIIQLILVIIIIPLFGFYWLSAMVFPILIGIGYLRTAKFYQSLTVEEMNNGTSLRVYFPRIQNTTLLCLSRRALERGVSIKFEDMKWYKVHYKEPDCCYFTGAYSAPFCSGKGLPVYWNINEHDCLAECCGQCSRWKAGQFLLEIKLKTPITFGFFSWYNDCQCCGYGCGCKARSSTLRISTDDLAGVTNLLNERGVKRDGVDVLTIYDGVSLSESAFWTARNSSTDNNGKDSKERDKEHSPSSGHASEAKKEEKARVSKIVEEKAIQDLKRSNSNTKSTQDLKRSNSNTKSIPVNLREVFI